MLKKILFFVTIFFASDLLPVNDPLKSIAIEIDNDLKTCSENQDCISTIDKHLVNLKQLQEQLKTFHTNQIPYSFSSDDIKKLLALNFPLILIYVASKLSNANADTTGAKLISFFLTSAWALGQWNDYGYREARLAQLEATIKFLENKKKELE